MGHSKIMQLLEIGMNFLVVWCVQTTLFAAFLPLGSAMEAEGLFAMPPVWIQLLMVSVPVGYWLIRVYAKKFLLFVAGHGLVWILDVWLFGQSGPQRFVFGLIAGAYLLNSFYARFSRQTDEEGGLGPIAAGIAGAGGFLICAYVGAEVSCGRILNAALVYTFLYFISMYLEQLARFVQFNRASNAHIPVNRMLMQGGGLTAACSLFVVVLLGAGTNQEWMGKLTAGVKAVLLWLVRLAARVLGFILSLFQGEEGTLEESAEGMAAMPAGVAESTQQPLWLELLIAAIEFLVLVAAAAGLCYVLYRLVMAAVRRFYERTGKEEESGNQQAVEIREKLKGRQDGKKRGGSIFSWARTPEEKIRKLFIKAVCRTYRYRNPEENSGNGYSGREYRRSRSGRDLWKAQAQNALVAGKTARELGQLVEKESEEKKEAFRRLTQLYERARYQGGCSEEDVKEAAKCVTR